MTNSDNRKTSTRPDGRLTFVLVHSPLIGPMSWMAVADQLRQRHLDVIVPALPRALDTPAPFLQHQVSAVIDAHAQTSIGTASSVVLVAHSGAGALLPLIGQRLPVPVSSYLFVDAGLPRPGSWIESMPAPAVDQLRSLEHDGQVPAWHTWFGGEAALVELLPDAVLRAQFIAELTPLPWKMFTEPRPEHPEWPDAPCGYLRLSEAYDADAKDAERRGWPTRRTQTHHLAVLTDARAITHELLALVGALSTPAS